MKKCVILGTMVLCALASGAGAGILVYDSQGFENFALGSAAGQTGCYYLDSGATRDGSFQIKTGGSSAATIVDIGGNHGQVLAFNHDAAGWTDTWHQIGWQGNASSGWVYEGETQYMLISFDFQITSPGAVSGAVVTWRNANQVQQAKVWVQEDTQMECRKDSDSAAFWPPYDTAPDATAGDWHHFLLVTMWDGDPSPNPVITAYLDGVALNVAGENNTWYTAWAGWTGYLDAMSFNYLVNEGEALLVDNLIWEYSDVPEPATVVLLALGGLTLFRKR